MDIEKEIDIVIEELEKKGVNQISHKADYLPREKGLGDVIEDALTKVGITQDKFKSWFRLDECDCTKRKKWLNKLFTWHYNNYKG